MKMKVISIIVFIVLAVGCSQVIRIGNLNMAHTYNHRANVINPSYYISHSDYDNSKINIRIPSKELLYRKKTGDNFFLANVNVNLKVFKTFERKSLLYNTDLQFYDTLYTDSEHIVIRESTFPLAMQGDYLIYLEFTDLNQRISHKQVVVTEKSNPFNAGFFTITANSFPDILLQPHAVPNSGEISISHSINNVFTMEVNRYQPESDFPTAPYVISTTTPALPVPDTTFRVAFINGKARLRLPGNGVFRFSEPANKSNGFTISSFWEQYPNLPSNETMLFPLRYLTSADEFNALFELGDYRLANERFWVRIAGNPDRGTAVMQRYNDRVVMANQYFGSHVPGWQTDMGMTYILFGPPDMVYLNESQQTWYYTESLHTPAIEFVFNLTENKISKNHYILQRNQSYRRNWNLAVDRWRR